MFSFHHLTSNCLYLQPPVNFKTQLCKESIFAQFIVSMKGFRTTVVQVEFIFSPCVVSVVEHTMDNW